MDVRVGLWRRLSAEELTLLSYGVREDFWESLAARRSNQSILKEISPGCSLERLMLKLKLQYFCHLMRRVDSLERPWCWEVLGARGEGDDRRSDGWMASLTRWTWVWVNSGSWWWTGRAGVLQFMGLQRVGHDWVIERNWTVHQRLSFSFVGCVTCQPLISWAKSLIINLFLYICTLPVGSPYAENPG